MSSNDKEYIYKKIGGIQYAILSPDQIRKLSTVKVITPELYDNDGFPVRGGLMDPRMGVVDPGLRCETCGKPVGKCPGHFGHIELAAPVYHIEFLPIIFYILQAVCHKCGRLKLPEEKIDAIVKKVQKLKEKKEYTKLHKFIKKIVIDQAKKVKVCPHCGEESPKKIEFKRPFRIFITDKEGITRRLFPSEARSILENIPEKDALALGFDNVNSRPEWMILTVLPVPPITVRPSIVLETGERAEDDLTHQLVTIVRINQRLNEVLSTGAPQVIVEDIYDQLQYHITAYINNNISGLPPAIQRSGKPIKSLVERISGKEGRIRYNLLGKRVNFAARAVLSPDIRIKPNEVGIPLEVAKTLTVPEKVTEYNIEWIRSLIKNGPDKHPGVNYVITPEGKRFMVTEENKELLSEKIEPGWIVERHLNEGDVVLFGRYPSLHRMSLMGHRVRILPGKTFRLNPISCKPYNADFDGDEMNVHVPQTEEAIAEAKYLTAIENYIISARYGLAIIGATHQIISGIYLLTQDDTKVSLSQATELVYLCEPSKENLDKLAKYIEKAKEEGRDYLTGKEIFSVFLPNDLIFKHKDVIIEDGELKSGVIDGSIIKQEKGILVYHIIHNYGNQYTIEWLHRISLLGVYYQYFYGLTISISDLDLPEEAIKEINKLIKEANEEVDKIIKLYKEGKLERVVGKSPKEVYESKVMKVLNDMVTKIGEVISKYSDPSKGIILLAQSKAKGGLSDLTRILVVLGQQAFRGKLIEFGYKKRNLSLFKKGEVHPIAKGWIQSGYKKGLEPWEFFFHALPGRDALMDTAIRTADSGYLYRRLAHAIYDIFCAIDHSARDTTGRVIQYKVGEDGLMVDKLEGGKLNIDSIINIALKKIKNDKK